MLADADRIANPVDMTLALAEQGQDLQAALELTACILFAALAAALAQKLRTARRGVPPEASPNQQPLLSGAPSPNEGRRMRRFLLGGLLGASSLRCLAFAFALCLSGSLGHALVSSLDTHQLMWLMDLVLMLPAMCFLSAFSLVILFWAKVHYTTTMTPMPALDYVFISINAGVYALIVVVAVCSFATRKYNILRVYMICSIGLLSLLSSTALFYYGIIVWYGLFDKARKTESDKRLTKRVLVLTIACPAALLGQSVCYMVWAVIAGATMGPLPVWENVLLCLCSEWLPSAIIVLTHQQLQQGAEDLPEDSDSEGTVLSEGPATPVARLGMPHEVTWKQIYPQP